MRFHNVSLSLLLCIGSCGYLLAQPAFFRKDIRVDPNPQAVAAGDVDGDSRPDLVVSSEGRLVVMLNSGDAVLGTPIVTEEMSAGGPLVIADFSGDGRDDVAVGRHVLISLGDGSFRTSQDGIGSARAAADFNADGKEDILATYGAPGGPDVPPPATPPSVLVWLGNGDGTFQKGATVTDSVEPWVVSVADLNSDGRSDVILQDFGGLFAFLGHGDGTFDAAAETRAVAWGAVMTSDFNGDGVLDLATEARILLGDGDGNFSRSVWFQTAPDGTPLMTPLARWPLAAGDFTGDGFTDVAVALEDRNFVLVYPGEGDGSLLPPMRQLIGWGSLALAATADLDEDGRLDILIANSRSNTVTALMSREEGTALPRAVSAASDTAVVAPESLATLIGAAPVTVTLSAFPPWPSHLGGISLEVLDSSGTTRRAPLVMVSPTQINFQVPAGTALGEATLSVVAENGTTEVGTMQVDAVAPALFMRSHPTSIPAATAVIVEPDGYQIGAPVFLCSPPGAVADCSLSGLPLSAYSDREIYVSFYGTGFRGANTDNVTCSIDGIPVPVVYAGPQATPGVEQINVRLVPELLYGRHHEEVVTMRINGVAANSAGISVD